MMTPDYIHENVPLVDKTTFEIGGGARYFADVKSHDELFGALDFARDRDLQYYILGGGSNVVFSDDGFNGLVIRINIQICEIMPGDSSCGDDDRLVYVGAGFNLLDLIKKMSAEGLGGMEALAGIPGSVGGAVRGNAGAFGSEICDFVVAVDVYDAEASKQEVGIRGGVKHFSAVQSEFAYRMSHFKSRPHLIILGVTLTLTKRDASSVSQAIKKTVAEREKRHIQNIKSAGSFFMNPVVGAELQEEFALDCGAAPRSGRVPAGWLIEKAGLEGKSIGGIKAGHMHANYFINTGAGSAEEVIQLSSLVKTRVRDMFDVRLQEEVQLVGF